VIRGVFLGLLILAAPDRRAEARLFAPSGARLCSPSEGEALFAERSEATARRAKARLEGAQEPLWSSGSFAGDHERTIAADGALTLGSEPGKWLKPQDPSKWHVVTDLKVFQGRLIASSCYDFDDKGMLSPWAYSDGNDFCEYLPAADEWKVIHSQKTSMVFTMAVVGDRLYAPEFHAFTANRLYAFDGKEFKESFPLPKEMLHGMEIAEWKGNLYLAGSWRTQSGGDARNDPNWYGGYARIYESSDAGATWREVYATKENGRVLSLAVWKDRLWANSRGIDLVSWDGTAWKNHPMKIKNSNVVPALGAGPLIPMGDKLAIVNSPLVYLFDGKDWDSVTPGYVACAKIGATLYGVRDDGHVHTSTDGKKWTKVTSEAIPKDEFDRKAPMGRPIRRGSIALYRGRLVVGTGATGTVTMSPLHEKGTATFAAVKAALPASAMISVDAAVPDGAKLTVQTRSAKTKDDLAKATWKSADESGVVKFAKGDEWLQVRAVLESDKDRRKGPFVRSILLK
jgi:hypothetical protein